MVAKVIGYMVFEVSEDFEQALRLLRGDTLPADGILEWREGRQPAALFPTRGDARDAIERTEHYRLAFDANLPERKFCKIVPVAMAQETSE